MCLSFRLIRVFRGLKIRIPNPPTRHHDSVTAEPPYELSSCRPKLSRALCRKPRDPLDTSCPEEYPYSAKTHRACKPLVDFPGPGAASAPVPTRWCHHRCSQLPWAQALKTRH